MANNLDAIQSISRRRQILVVDDEMINREILGEFLKDDYDTLFAEDGAQALDLIRENKDTLSLVLLDLLMPVVSGKEVLKRLREDPELARIPVIVLTADQESEVECLGLGAIDFIPKPYPDVSVVLARILRTIELSEDRSLISSTERDVLTGLYNKEFFYHYAELFDQFHKGVETDAVILDIIHFRMINERYGKDHGDMILKNIAQALRDAVRDSGGIVCRREADNFLIYCPHRDDYDEILEQASVPSSAEEQAAGRIRLRIGVYANTDKTIDMERRFDRAKMASELVQNSITNTIGIYDDAMRKKEILNEQLIEDFQDALDEKQFEVYYQPKFDIRPDEPILSSAEALIRWKHPKLGMVSPGVFIPLFESNGLVRKLDWYVWREAGRQIREWKDRLGFSVPVSVNVSRIDLYDPNLFGILDDILKTNDIKSDDLLLEITESAYTGDSQQIIDTVKKLRMKGFRIEMDDFGSGYSSLNMLSTLPIDALKLDIQFIRSAFRDGGNARMLEVTIDIADSLSVPVVAEGVETKDQVAALRAMGCDIVQGYYFSKPVPAGEFEPFIVKAKEVREAAEAERQEELEKLKRKKLAAMVSSDVPLSGDAAESNDLSTNHPIRPDRRNSDGKGIHMRMMNIIFAVIAFLTAAALFCADTMVTRGYLRMEEASNNYTTARQAASDMESGSDYLTDRVRTFVVTGDTEYLKDFFEEVEVTRRREKALDDLKELLEESSIAYDNLSAALDLSNQLVERENLAMRLRVEAGDYAPEDIPAVISDIQLSAEDAALSRKDLSEKARDLVFDNVYLDYKERIHTNVSRCTDELILISQEALTQASSRMEKLLRIQTILTGVLLIVVFLFVFFIRYEIRVPLMKMVSHMQEQKPVPPTGAEELRYVSRVYNEILLENKKAYAQLTYEASHDPLTGLLNRGAYEMLLNSVEMEHVALMMIDVNFFKQINDTYGHDVGDRILKVVADTLKQSFRSSDVICRFGGDEFIVIMTRANNSMRQLVLNKVAQINEQLKNPRGDLPPVSLSVGVSFSDPNNPNQDIFKEADTALYEAKKDRTGRCEIY